MGCRLERYKRFLADKGLRYTFERRCIYEEIQKTQNHFHSDGLYERFRKRGERISRGTVYRNMPLLLEAGVLQKSAGDGHKDYYEKASAKGHHDHMICVHCGKIIEFHSEGIEEHQRKACAKYKFRMTFHDHRLFGYCQQCQ